MNKLAVLIPSFNEEDNLKNTISIIQKKIDDLIKINLISKDSLIVIIDDGSTDDTWDTLKKLKKKFTNLKALKLSKNYGHQVALFAGIKEFKNSCDFSISIDADMQHDINKFKELVSFYKKKYDIVIGISDRRTDNFFKKFTASIFYKILNLISSSKIEPHHADFRLLSSKVMNEISKYENKNIFLRGIIAKLNFKTKNINYILKERKIGKSKYSFSKMLQLALDGVTSQSTYPLRIATITGFIILIFCFISSIMVFYNHFINKNTIPGWATIVLPIYFLGGVQIFILGIIGEYIAKIYKEVNKIPSYSILEILD